MTYKILNARITDSVAVGTTYLAEQVQEWLDRGWELAGGVSISKEYAVQALVLKPKAG